jgi:hypothetical protein
MINHDQLFNLANALGIASMAAVIAYHFIEINASHLSKSVSK